jgi:hypothetical protein
MASRNRPKLQQHRRFRVSVCGRSASSRACKTLAAFEISAKNRKNDENNKREQAEFNKIGHLSEASR